MTHRAMQQATECMSDDYTYLTPTAPVLTDMTSSFNRKPKNTKKLSLSTCAAQKLAPSIQISNSVPSTPTSQYGRKVLPRLPALDTRLAGLSRQTSMPITQDELKMPTPVEDRWPVNQIPSQVDRIMDQTCENCDLDSYTCGPVCIVQPNLYLYSEPSAEQVRHFDVVINVAKEIDNPLHADLSGDRSQSQSQANEKGSNPEYIHLPWQHNQNFGEELPHLTALIDRKINASNQKVLVHCQQGVSRSASLIIAYIMKSQSMDINEAYAYVKSKSPCIGPNMSLIYQLCEWGKTLAKPDTYQHRRSFDVYGAKTMDAPHRKRSTSSVERVTMARSRSESGAVPSARAPASLTKTPAPTYLLPSESVHDGYLSHSVQRLQDLQLSPSQHTGKREFQKLLVH